MTSPDSTRHQLQHGHGWLVLGALAAIAIALICGPLLAGGARDVRAAEDGTAEHLISVMGVGKFSVRPDVADVSLGVIIQRPSAREARDAAAQRMTEIIVALRALGIAEEDIRSATIDLSPTYDYNSSSPRITGYQVSNIVTVHVLDIARVADVIDDAIAAGATTVSGVTFDVSDRAAAEEQARELAIRDARARADGLAAAAGVTITGVASISETTVSTPWPWYGVDRGAGEAPTPVLPGTTDITISVSVAYLIG
jgi:hypothetical protein